LLDGEWSNQIKQQEPAAAVCMYWWRKGVWWAGRRPGQSKVQSW
jgi:hypothetical protein